jgi:hypothetical protein
MQSAFLRFLFFFLSSFGCGVVGGGREETARISRRSLSGTRAASILRRRPRHRRTRPMSNPLPLYIIPLDLFQTTLGTQPIRTYGAPTPKVLRAIPAASPILPPPQLLFQTRHHAFGNTPLRVRGLLVWVDGGGGEGLRGL